MILCYGGVFYISVFGGPSATTSAPSPFSQPTGASSSVFAGANTNAKPSFGTSHAAQSPFAAPAPAAPSFGAPATAAPSFGSTTSNNSSGNCLYLFSTPLWFYNKPFYTVNFQLSFFVKFFGHGARTLCDVCTSFTSSISLSHAEHRN